MTWLRSLLPLRSTALLGLLALSAPVAAQSASGGIVINELRTDQPSTDNDEYFELKGPGGASLAGYTYFVIGDDSGGGEAGAIEWIYSFGPGDTLPADGLLLVGGGDDGDGVAFGVTADINADPNFENSDSVTHVLATGFTGTDAQDLDTDDDGDLDVTPWATVADAIGFADDLNDIAYGDVLGFEDLGPVGAFPPSHAFRDGSTDAWILGDFDPALSMDTPGAGNPTVDPVEPGAPEADFALAVWPNPASEAVTVRVTAGTTQALEVAIYDALGRRVALLFEGMVPAGASIPVRLDASSLPAGLYVVRVTGATGAAAHRFSVVR